jgi:type I restriction enzyme, S subunit
MPIEFHRDGPWGLPEGWVWARLGQLGRWTGGGTPSKANAAFWVNGTIPWVSPKDMKVDVVGDTEDYITPDAVTHSTTKVVTENSILMVVRSGILKHTFPVALTDRDVTLNQDMRALSPLNGIDARYLTFVLRRLQRQILDECSKDGTTVASVEPALLEQVWVPMPPTAEQCRIVARIDELFIDIEDGETALARASDDLGTWRRALLKAAVTGELTREWREQNRPNEKGEELLGRIREIRSSLGRRAVTRRASRSADELELPHFDLPETWCSATWSEIGISQNGRPFPSSDYSECGVKLLRPGNLYANGQIRWTKTNTRYLPEHHLVDNPDLLVRGGELIINLTAQSLKDEFLGRVCITDPDEHCLLNQRLARLTPIEVLPAFALLVFKSSLFRSFVRQLNSGSLIQHMFTSQIEGFLFPLPPVEEQAAIVASVNHAVGAVEEMEELGARGTETPVHLRQSILKAAFEGRLVEQDPRDEPAEALLTRIGEGARQSPLASSHRARRARSPSAGAEA